MPQEIARAPGGALAYREQRRLARSLQTVQLPARLAAARIDAAAFAAHTALHHAAMLSSLESQLIEQVPLGEARYKGLVDSFTGYAAGELMRLNLE